MAKKNLLDKYFGQLYVVEETKERASDGSIIWRCECECGNKNFLISTSTFKIAQHTSKIVSKY